MRLFMYKTLKERISECETKSEWVIVVFIDVRGFTSFCGSHKTKEVALFIQKTYLKLLNEEYFDNILFSKPTGDGMVFVIPYNEENFKDKINEVILKSRQLIEDFPTLFQEEAMVYFETPENIGIGISRGEACCLIGPEGVIDYSGQVLNEAARLMDIARPKGIIIKNNFIKSILEEENASILYEDDEIYLRGVAETNSIKVYYTKKWTMIETGNKIPFGILDWVSDTKTESFEACEGIDTTTVRLTQIPISESAIQSYLEFSSPRGDGSTWTYKMTDRVIISRDAGKYYIEYKTDEFEHFIEKGYISKETKCTLRVSYPIRERKS